MQRAGHIPNFLPGRLILPLLPLVLRPKIDVSPSAVALLGRQTPISDHPPEPIFLVPEASFWPPASEKAPEVRGLEKIGFEKTHTNSDL